MLWQNVSLRDKPNDGQFTFQATLHKNGDIVFVYQTVPLIVSEIQNDDHPTRIGLSDAYLMDHDDFSTFIFTNLRHFILFYVDIFITHFVCLYQKCMSLKVCCSNYRCET